MTGNNLVIISKYEAKNSIYPAEQKVLCESHYQEKTNSLQDYQINKINSLMPEIWCDTCNPIN